MSYHFDSHRGGSSQAGTSFAIGGREEIAIPAQWSDLRAGGRVFLQGRNCEIIAIQPSEFNSSMVRIVRRDAKTKAPMNDQYVNVRETVYVPCEETYNPPSSGRNEGLREDARGPSSQMVARTYQPSNGGYYLQ
ncbi:hypothetical protein BDV38DRAFT_284931 [Aspergillus pseudotamarii]|uniref:Uncharacterized protein n=1 Tax=Aspergillus pseudotamarii TaxID=132259 RepID=A0A5N6SLC5_ASPPS|nr:uncharacterized protein BDV38DRAFT_284931 [Aspergillus pseudotamarii]KAE8135498.1 hypothetical protein BDV38DRAFT_284931 [Aspergillus pseudotamarii]